VSNLQKKEEATSYVTKVRGGKPKRAKINITSENMKRI
jgi:hypothetical protein